MPLENYLQISRDYLSPIWDYNYEHSFIPFSIFVGIVLACMVAIGMFRAYLRRRNRAAVRAAALTARVEPQAIKPLTQEEKIRRLLERAEAERGVAMRGRVLTEMAFLDDADAAKRGVVQLDPYSPRAYELAAKTDLILAAAQPKAEGRVALAAGGEWVAQTKPLSDIKHTPRRRVPLNVVWWCAFLESEPAKSIPEYRLLVFVFGLNLEHWLWELRMAELKVSFDKAEEKRRNKARDEQAAVNAVLGLSVNARGTLTLLQEIELERQKLGMPPTAAAVQLQMGTTVRTKTWRPPPPKEKNGWFSWLQPQLAQERRQPNWDLN